jgi:hypothetical protein
MRHGFRTQTPGNRHPDGESGLLQIYQFSNNAINRTGEGLVQIIATNLIQAVYGSSK